MNTIHPNKTRTAWLCLSIALAFTLTLHAQKPAPPATTPPADPFTRDGNPPPARTAENQDAPALIYGLLEYIEVPADAWLDYTARNPTRHDVTELRAEVQRWITEGKAKPFDLTCVPTKSGNRVLIESILEYPYPVVFIAATPRPVPTGFDTRNAHLEFEWEPALSPDGRYTEIMGEATLVTFAGSGPQMRSDEPRKVEDTQPRFTTVTQVFTNTVAADVPVLLSVATPRDANGQRRENTRLLCFLRAAPYTLKQSEAPKRNLRYLDNGKPATMSIAAWNKLASAAAKDPAAQEKVKSIKEQLARGVATLPPENMSVEIERLEVKLPDLQAWFAGKPLQTAASELREAAIKWIREGRGRTVDRQSGPIRSGIRAVWKDVDELRYTVQYAVDGSPNEVSLPQNLVPKTIEEFAQVFKLSNLDKTTVLKNPEVSPISHDVRDVGYIVDLVTVLGPDGVTADINLEIQDSRLIGLAAYHHREINGQAQTTVEQPIFGTMSVTTNVTARLGQPILLGINTPMEDDTRPSADRRILTFITIRD